MIKTKGLRRASVASLAAAFLLSAVTFSGASRAWTRDDQTALDRYIARPDSSFSWKLVKTIPGQGYTAFVLEMTSQTWRTADEVDRPQWKHWLTICKPDSAAFDKALLYIGGGSNNDPAPSASSSRIAAIATDTHSVTAELG